MKKIIETGSYLDTDPSLYTGYKVDPVTGKAVEAPKDGDTMSDPDRHDPEGKPKNNPTPAIVVQAEAYKPGFSIGLFIEDRLDIANADLTTPFKGLNFINKVYHTNPDAKLIWEDAATGQTGFVTPALFIKVYSKLFVEEQKKEAREQNGSEQKPMSESKPNMALANELLNVGLINNVKGTAKVLKEDNPMRKAMEIYYSSKNSNVEKDEVKYIPSQLKEGKMVLEKKSAPVVPEKEAVVETKKKRIIIW